MRAATSAPATQRPRRAPSRAAAMPASVAAATLAPSTPALTAAATAAAPASAIDVLWVTWLARTTWSTRAGRSSAGDRDADRGDAHRGAVRVARGAGLLRRDAGQDRLDRALGGRAEEVERPAGGHLAFPGDQGGGELAGVDRAVAEKPAQQDRLLGVVGDRARGQAGRDRVAGRGGLEAGEQGAPAFGYLRRGTATESACRARRRWPGRTGRPWPGPCTAGTEFSPPC